MGILTDVPMLSGHAPLRITRTWRNNPPFGLSADLAARKPAVVELQGGTSNARFSYRVMCKRKYYEDERLATEEQDIQYNTRVLQTAWPEVIAERKEMEARLNSMRPKGGREVTP